MIPIKGGRNNRAYKILYKGKICFMKQYNISSGYQRLEAEYSFLNHAIQCNSLHVTTPIFRNKKLGIGIYHYIEGNPYKKGDITNHDIQEALKFISVINQDRSKPSAKTMQRASEACFSIAEHIAQINNRLTKLSQMIPYDDIDYEAHHFIENELKAAWSYLENKILKKENPCHSFLNQKLDWEDRVISPSDFGFHNALKLPNEKVMFVDFEYSGWDDPAKLVGDFFNQIEIPVPIKYFTEFTENVSKLVYHSDEMIERTKLLLPLYSIKWCCIVLNYFLPDGKLQKEFVLPIKYEDRKLQLQKAKLILKNLEVIND